MFMLYFSFQFHQIQQKLIPSVNSTWGAPVNTVIHIQIVIIIPPKPKPTGVCISPHPHCISYIYQTKPQTLFYRYIKLDRKSVV